MRISDWSSDVCSSDLLGAIAAMLNPQQRGELLGHSIGLVKARAIIVGEECRAALESTDYAPGSTTELVHWWDGESAAPAAYQDLRTASGAASAANPPATAQVQMRDPCFYIFTSGTDRKSTRLNSSH